MQLTDFLMINDRGPGFHSVPSSSAHFPLRLESQVSKTQHLQLPLRIRNPLHQAQRHEFQHESIRIPTHKDLAHPSFPCTQFHEYLTSISNQLITHGLHIFNIKHQFPKLILWRSSIFVLHQQYRWTGLFMRVSHYCFGELSYVLRVLVRRGFRWL